MIKIYATCPLCGNNSFIKDKEHDVDDYNVEYEGYRCLVCDSFVEPEDLVLKTEELKYE